ncbi:ATP-dependent protease La Type I [hydrothermal vent metagenome]|uniref:endopeptidase La n=1 Tax=hydrothermal vent metagenome TaxID=652676 RepID=A0A1W1EIX7_9ZZZZ
MKLSDYGDFPSILPIIVEEEIFLYPFMISPIFLSQKEDIDAIEYAISNNSLIFIASLANKDDDNEINSIGVVGSIMRKVDMPDNRVKILFQGFSKAIIKDIDSNKPYLMGHIDIIEYDEYNRDAVTSLMKILHEKLKTLSSITNNFPSDIIKSVEDNSKPNRVVDLVSSMLNIDRDKAYRLFVENSIENRLLGLIEVVIKKIESSKLEKEIRGKVNSKIEKTNKEYFLKEQLKEIQSELGVDAHKEEEIEAFREKLEKIKTYLNDDAYKEVSKQLNKLSRMHQDSGDYSTIHSYLEWVFDTPFGKLSKKPLHISEVEDKLNQDHYSIDKAKDRIIEYFSVKELTELRGKKENRGVILCFAGPPGVGKTSLATSIASALKRPLVRLALGGLEDVNELRGHRRTYVGAMPGRVVQGLVEAGSMNPVIVLDEIDKVGRSMRGDPTSALLEILDPEQNAHYRDYYLNFHIDLSGAIFIATANDIGKIPAPLRDRMEFIALNSYTPNEKFEIAKRYLIPQELKKNSLRRNEFNITDPALKVLIDEYTREAGVRNLRRKIDSLIRKSAKEILQNELTSKVSITLRNLHKYVDKKVFEISPIANEAQVGVVNGLAWTSVGGDVLTIEAVKIRGKGVMQLTGNLGDVMKESARIAMSVVKILIDEKYLDIPKDTIPLSPKEKEDNIVVSNSEIYKRYDLHIHIPEGATPKDGPSAGIALCCVIASILSNQKIDNQVAMTGEVTLIGKVLPIGGLKEKLIAGYKAGVTKALIPTKNYERDLEDIPDEVKESMEIIPVDNIREVLDIVLI